MARKSKDEYNAYMRAYMLRRYHHRMAAARKFLGGRCIDCGTSKKLELDHEDRTTKVATVSRLWSYSEKRFWEEVRKCVLRCQKHHLDKGRRVGDVKPKTRHGTLTMYQYHRCRCKFCVRKNRQYSREWAARQPK